MSGGEGRIYVDNGVVERRGKGGVTPRIAVFVEESCGNGGSAGGSSEVDGRISLDIDVLCVRTVGGEGREIFGSDLNFRTHCRSGLVGLVSSAALGGNVK